MGLLTSAISVQQPQEVKEREASRQVEAMVLKTMLDASGAFKGGEGAGASIHAQLFTEALADAVAGQKGLGLAALLGPRPQPAPAAVSPQGLVMGPSHLSSGFGARQDPIAHQASFHAGLDLAAPEGSPICAAADGTVVSAGPRGGYGNAVEIAHADGTTTLYGHVASFSVGQGQSVHAGEPIATVGSTGRSTGNHLHFEVRAHGRPVEPLHALQVYRERAEATGSGPLKPDVRHED